MPTIYDNKDLTLSSGLQKMLPHFRRIDIATGYIDLRGWSELSEKIAEADFDESVPLDNREPVARILVGMVAKADSVAMLDALYRDVRGDNSHRLSNRERNEARDYLVRHLREQLTRGMPTEQAAATLRALGKQLASGRVQMKVYTLAPLHGKTYILSGGSIQLEHMAFVGSSNFTRAGLTSNMELNVDVKEEDAALKLQTWFNELWEDRRSLTISHEVLELIEESWATGGRTPYEIYLKICYCLSQDMRDGLGYVLPPSLEEILLDYQKTAVKILSRRIVRRGGTMLGDVVGLGKTMTAIATAAMLQNAEDYRTLVLCPKNLVSMWKEHLAAYDIEGTVVPYSMAEKTLPQLNRRYHLVICDESHNLRNDTRKDYRAIRSFVEEFECKVLLLTATPYNLSFQDVANQLALYIDDDYDLGIMPTVALEKNPELADKVDGKLTYLAAFRQSDEPDDWRRLMSDHLVRRTRSFIRRSAPKKLRTLPDGSQVEAEYMRFANGAEFFFPERRAHVISHEFAMNDPARLMEDDVTLDALRDLILPRYQLHKYYDERLNPTPEDIELMEKVRSGGGNVVGFVRVGLFKRLSSSSYSFVESLTRQRNRNEVFLYALEQGLKLPLGSFTEKQFGTLDLPDDTEGMGEEEFEGVSPAARYSALVASAPRATKWVNSWVFSEQLNRDLQKDLDSLNFLLERFGSVTAQTDSKLHKLAELARGLEGEKLLVFTEYKDTAHYLADGLRELGIENVEAVTGDTKDPGVVARRFSPKSNRLPDSELDGETEESSEQLREGAQGQEEQSPLDILIATDVLSEGQNLQDCHTVINYDLPWAIIRLIQRAGRVDRVGQESPTVDVYLLTHQSIEEHLSLRSRIEQRLSSAAQAFGSDERFFNLEQERVVLDDFFSGQLTEEHFGDEEDSADATSEAWLVWSYILEHKPELARKIENLPDLAYATRDLRPDDANKYLGTYISTASGLDIFAVREFNPNTDTYTMRLMTAEEALKLFKAEPTTRSVEPLEGHFEMQAELVRDALQKDALQVASRGNLRGVRKQVWNRFHRASARTGSMESVLAGEANEALNVLYSRPLQRAAEHELRLALRNRVSNEDLKAVLVRLHEAEKLVISGETQDTERVVCSLGITNPQFDRERENA